MRVSRGNKRPADQSKILQQRLLTDSLTIRGIDAAGNQMKSPVIAHLLSPTHWVVSVVSFLQQSDQLEAPCRWLESRTSVSGVAIAFLTKPFADGKNLESGVTVSAK